MPDAPILTEEEMDRLRVAALISMGFFMGMGYRQPVFLMWTVDSGWDKMLGVDGSQFPYYEVKALT